MRDLRCGRRLLRYGVRKGLRCDARGPRKRAQVHSLAKLRNCPYSGSHASPSRAPGSSTTTTGRRARALNRLSVGTRQPSPLTTKPPGSIHTHHGHGLQSTAPCAARTRLAPDARLPHRFRPSSHLCHSHHPRGHTQQTCRPGRAGQRGSLRRRCQHERPLPRPVQDLGPAIEEAVQRPSRRVVGPSREEELRRAGSRGENNAKKVS